MPKLQEKEIAIAMRRNGKTYAQILETVHVAKSTLSLWLRSVELALPQKQRITELRIEAARRGAAVRKESRHQEIRHFDKQGKNTVGKITRRELLLIATALYWAEGSKQNARSKSAGVIVGNSDPRLLKVFLKWLQSIDVDDSDVVLELYIHRERQKDTELFKKWWSQELSVTPGKISRVYYKRGNPKTKRSNVDDLYHGLLRIKVRESTSLNREISGYISAIANALGCGVTGNTSAFEAEDSRIVP